MDQVFLHGLEIDTVIGIFDWEREVRQTVIIDLDMGWDIREAAAVDRLEATLDYKAVAKRVTAEVSASRFQLVESLAERLADLVREEFRVPWIQVRVNKRGAITGAGDVGVVIERGER